MCLSDSCGASGQGADDDCVAQREQREELQRLVKKYGKTWEPWKAELKKHKGEGKEWTEGP